MTLIVGSSFAISIFHFSFLNFLTSIKVHILWELRRPLSFVVTKYVTNLKSRRFFQFFWPSPNIWTLWDEFKQWYHICYSWFSKNRRSQSIIPTHQPELDVHRDQYMNKKTCPADIPCWKDSLRLSSSHDFSIPESTNLRIFFTNFSLFCFFTRQKFSFEIKNDDTITVYHNRERHCSLLKMKSKISWKQFVDSGFVKTCDELVVSPKRGDENSPNSGEGGGSGSLPRTLSTSVLRIKHRRTFWEKCAR